jgi:TPR repeat protein
MSNNAEPEIRLVASPPLIPILLPPSEFVAREAFFADGKATGFRQFLHRAKAGSSAAQAVVAYMYLNKWVDDENYLIAATNWARSSAEQNDPYGRWVMAWALLEQQDVENGMSQMFEAAECGFTPAQYDLGKFLISGAVFPKDVKTGLALISTAASNGHNNARSSLETAIKLGAFGPAKRLVAHLTLPLIRPIRFVFWLLFKRKFTEKNLYYLRAMHVRNAIRRDLAGETVGFELENQLDELLKEVRAE